MREHLADMVKQKQEFLRKKWTEIEELAKKGQGGEIARLEPEIKRLQEALPRKTTEKEKERITKAIRLQVHRLKKLQWAVRQIARRDQAERDAAPKPAPVVAQAEGEEVVSGEGAVVQRAAGGDLNTNLNNRVVVSMLPKHLARPLPEPFTLDGVVIEWADMYDAEYAKSWPEDVVHEVMGAVRRRPPVPMENRLKYPIFEPVYLAQQAATQEAEVQQEEPPEKKEMEQKYGILKYLWSKKNPLRINAIHKD